MIGPWSSMIQRRGSAEWQGNLKAGKGTVSTESGALKSLPYSFGARFENGTGTNPEELIAAAHAACFSMAYSAQLEGKGVVPQRIQTTATATLEKEGAGWSITKLHLDVRVSAPRADPSVLQAAADTAKATCPVSRVLKGAAITMDLKPGG